MLRMNETPTASVLIIGNEILSGRTQDANLANIALDVGYPDSTHFSHSVRQVYGLTPKSIFAGCRKLALYGYGTAGAQGYGMARAPA